MKKLGFLDFLRDKSYFLIASVIVWLILNAFLFAFKVVPEAIILLNCVGVVFVAMMLAVEYYRKQTFYRNLLQNLSKLDQGYLVLETLEEPHFYDGEIIYQALYRATKSMTENVQQHRSQIQDFRDYIEMWIHEVKTPLATLAVISHDPQIAEQVRRIDDYVEQILYFARAENAERDYLIKESSLQDMVGEAINRNRELLLAHHITVETHGLDCGIQTDPKWLAFIVNQILGNSIKYGSTVINFTAHETTQEVILAITDNGIGISTKDLPRVFDKTFTGQNGRQGNKSTGMGLYIAKNLCTKLGHQISIDSQANQFTTVKITFAKNGYYKNVI